MDIQTLNMSKKFFMSDLLQMFMLHYGQIYFVTICFETRTTRTGTSHQNGPYYVSSFLADLQLMVHVKAILPY
jgi:hypothetical protein